MSDAQVISSADNPEMSAEDITTAKTVGDALNAAYPGHLWAVNCRSDQGVLTIQNFMLPAKYGFLIKLPDIYSASHLKRLALTGAGELLERWNMTRGAFNDDEYSSLPKRAGEVIGDIS